MGIDLNKLKDLRERGASVQMQEDLASFLDDGYDSDLFLPTIDFILMLQNKAQSQSAEQENTLDLSDFDIPEVYDPTYYDKISIKASAELVKSAAIEEQLKLEILAYLDAMDIQRNVGKNADDAPKTRAHISAARRRDRNQGKVKSMFESIVSGLNSLQVRLSQQNANTKKQQEKSMQQNRIRDIIRQKLMRDHVELKDDNAHDNVAAKKERKFLKFMRKADIANKKKNDNENAGNDSQQNRSGGNDKERFQESKAVADVAHKYEQAQEQAAKSAGEYKKTEEKKDAQITASKTIGETKQAEAEIKQSGADKSGDKDRSDQKIRNTNLQAKLQRTRVRMQRQREDALRQQEQAKHAKIDDRVAAKAVNQLKSMGVSMGDADFGKVSNKDINQIAKLQDKQRGG